MLVLFLYLGAMGLGSPAHGELSGGQLSSSFVTVLDSPRTPVLDRATAYNAGVHGGFETYVVMLFHPLFFIVMSISPPFLFKPHF